MCFTPWDTTLSNSFIRYTWAKVGYKLNSSWLDAAGEDEGEKKLETRREPNRAFFSPQTGCCLLYTNVSPTEKRKKSRKRWNERVRDSVCLCVFVCEWVSLRERERESERDGWLAKRNMPRIHNEVDIWDSRQWGDVPRVTWPQTCGKKTKCNFHID